ncbi:testis-expressed protein 2 isoform X2 [Periplaneta americana]|uniref:testis-expressed protein 2 isoform X2 n=1 Tax=Periplaneta americana TaxID=6978 RepID=UPI0037E95ABD
MEQHKRIQGKTITTSVPTFAFRFHAEDEELEEIYPSADETDEEADKQEEESSSSAGGTQVAAATTASATSSSATPSTIHSRDPSPMKEYLKGFGKRSTSVDAGMIDGGSPASSSDTWRIFHELRGKIAKTVEEKFSEMKNDRRSSSLAFSGGPSIRGGRLGGGSSKDDSSINSDSEDISESSNKGLDSKSIKKKEKVEEGSPRKVLVSQETSKRDDDDNVSNSLETASTSGSQDTGGNLSVPTTPRRGRKVIMDVSSYQLRYRKNGKGLSGFDSDTVYDEGKSYIEEEVESGVEVNEEMNLDMIEEEDPNLPTTDYRQPHPVTYPPLPPRRERRRSIMSKLKRYSVKLLPILAIIIYCLIPLSPYISGFLSGIALSVGIGAIYFKITRLTAPSDSNVPDDGILQMGTEFRIPDYSSMPILEVPKVKEYHHINKYQGWMNEYRHEYNPETYHLSDTESVYVRLDGTTLRISHTKLRIPKRAMWNERTHKLKFYHQRIYSLENCTLKLLPDGLARKRLWSKKYPICIILNRDSKVKVEDIVETREKLDEEDSFKVTDSTADEILDETEHQSSQHSKSEAAPEEEDDSADTYNQISEVKDLQSTTDMPVDDSDDETFCHIDKTEVMENCLYFFARTDREKEDWYRKFAAALRYKSSPESTEEDLVPMVPEVASPSVVSPTSSDENLSESLSDSHISTTSSLPAGIPHISGTVPGQPFTLETNEYMTVRAYEARDFEYLRFMSKFQQVQRYKMQCKVEKEMCAALKHVHSHSAPPKTEAAKKKQEKMEAEIEAEVDKLVDADVLWINAMVGRVLFDVLKNPYWVQKIQERLQRKLSIIKLPYIIEDLLITDLDLGHNLPMAHRASHPVVDERGLWVDLDITYEGTICFTLETKLNLMKLKEMGSETAAQQAAAEKEEIPLGDKSKSPMYDSDMDDSAESSDDEEDDGKSTSGEEKGPPPPSAGKKLIKVVNKIASSKYFQQATKYKYVQKAMEGVSNTRLMLTVEVNALVGTLAVNIPPPPSDRIWYGFRGNPRLWLQARPKLGERQVNIVQVTSWIEKQLCQEFQKKFVLPNMDDIVIPPMTSQLPD